MAAKSILKDVSIKEQRLAHKFLEAMDNAENMRFEDLPWHSLFGHPVDTGFRRNARHGHMFCGRTNAGLHNGAYSTGYSFDLNQPTLMASCTVVAREFWHGETGMAVLILHHLNAGLNEWHSTCRA